MTRLVDHSLDFLGGVLFLSAAFKHDGFREEKEWRLIARDEHVGETGLRFREGRSGIVPYVELGLVREDGTIRIDEIVVGPNPHSGLAKQAILSVLKAHAVTHDGVRASQTPFRAW